MAKSSVELIFDAEEKTKAHMRENAAKLKADIEKAERDAAEKIKNAELEADRYLAAREAQAREKCDELKKTERDISLAEAREICDAASKNLDAAAEAIIRGICVK